MRYIKEIFKLLWETIVVYHYESVVEIIHRIKTGEDKFYYEIKKDKERRKNVKG